MGGRNSKMYIHEQKNLVNTRKQLKTGEVTEASKITKPLCSQFPDEGSVNFYSHRDMNSYEGIFSFVLYYNVSNKIEDFKQTKYYLGLLLYAEIIDKNPFFTNYGMIVYTDEDSYELLSSFLLIYPKLILAVTHWPQFAINSTITGTVLRCLRFHALEAFPNSHILVRDADTIFIGEIASFDHVYASGYKTTDAKTGEVIEDYRQFLINKIGDWEQQFVELWLKEGSPMLFGVSPDYLDEWHSEFPFIYPIKNLKTQPRFNYLIKHLRTRKQYEQINMLGKERGDRFKNYQKATGIEFYKKSPSGIYAGFVNFLRTRPDDLWLYSYDYIARHYKLIEVEDKKKEISNLRLWIHTVGKDERILIFTMIIKYVSRCFFLYIDYNSSKEQEYYSDNNSQPTYVTLANIIGEVSFRNAPNINENTEFRIIKRKGNYKIRTHMLQPNYLPSVFVKKLDNATRATLRFKSNFYRNLTNKNYSRSLNEIYKSHFKAFSKEYLLWLTFIMSKSEEEIQKNLETIITSKKWNFNNPTRNDYISIDKTNFYEPPRRIAPSRLPPIVPESNSPPSANNRGGVNKTRRSSKNLLWFNKPVGNNRPKTRRNNNATPSLLD